MAWLCSIPSAWQISFANAGLALPANTLRRSRSCIILSTGFEAAIILASCALSVPAATARDNARGRPAKLETSVLPPTTLLRGKSRYHPGTTRTGRCRFPSSGPRRRGGDGAGPARGGGGAGPRLHQSLLECSQLPVMFEDHAFKIVAGGSETRRIPRNRLETKYFILLQFGCQTGAQVAVGLRRVHVDARSHQNAPLRRRVRQRKQLASAPDSHRRSAQ